MGQFEEQLLNLSHILIALKSVPPIAVSRVENQNEPKRPPPFSRLGSFWFSTRFTRKKMFRLAWKNRVHRYFSSLCKLEI